MPFWNFPSRHVMGVLVSKSHICRVLPQTDAWKKDE